MVTPAPPPHADEHRLVDSGRCSVSLTPLSCIGQWRSICQWRPTGIAFSATGATAICQCMRRTTRRSKRISYAPPKFSNGQTRCESMQAAR